jgi:hypothetical protein
MNELWDSEARRTACIALAIIVRASVTLLNMSRLL